MIRSSLFPLSTAALVTSVAFVGASHDRATEQATAPTVAQITAADLKTRVYIFADDSMGGRLAGSTGNQKATDYIAAELQRMGVQPAGTDGYFQSIIAPSPGGRITDGFPDPKFRNVVGVIPGSDPTLGAEYVALGAHNDHIGYTTVPVDHDSARAHELAITRMERRLGRPATRAERSSIRVNVDSLRRLRPARLDSINNGADDDGSGSMALLEIAEYFASMNQSERPRRSILLVWHSNEEIDLGGSRFFVQNPTVRRQNIVAQINIDMVGRGTAEDVEGGGADYLAMVGSRRVSRTLGDIIDSVNNAATPARKFALDYSWDAPNHPEQIYSRSDHYNYAVAGIPVAFMFTGLHADYHRVTDEPQYLDYMKLEKVALFAAEIVRAVGDRDKRPAATRLAPLAPAPITPVLLTSGRQREP